MRVKALQNVKAGTGSRSLEVVCLYPRTAVKWYMFEAGSLF